jgi:ribose transport system ATP-binding protein
MAGLVGSGRSELARVLFGVEPFDAGEIWLNGRRVHIANPQHAVQLGLGLVPEDRKTQGLVLSLSMRKNVTLPILDRLHRFGILDDQRERQVVQARVNELAIKTPSIEQEVQYLSGGNQQKVVMAKWLSANPQVIILDEPTRGIDVGTKVEMYSLMRQLARQGTGIIMISSELDEILGMSDRVLVMCRGRLAGEFTRAQVTEEKILTLAIGETL